MLEKLKCNHFDISIRESNEIDLNELIPKSILPSDNELAELREVEADMQDGVGSDAFPEAIYNQLIESALADGDTRDALLYTVAANFGLRISDCLRLKLIQFIDSTGHFRHKLYWEEQKTSKNRVLFINKAIQTALVLYLRDNPNKKLLDYPFMGRSHNLNWRKETYIDERGKEKAVRKNGKYVYLLDENGNKILDPATYAPIEKKLKQRLKAIGAPVATGNSVRDGEFKLTTHSFRKTYGEKFTQIAMEMKNGGEIILDADVQTLITLDYLHTSTQTTLRYVKRFERVKESVCARLNLGLSTLEKYIK